MRKKNGSNGTSFSFLQALAQLAHPIHLSISIPIPYHLPLPFGSSIAYTGLKGLKIEANKTLPAIAPDFLKKSLLE